MNVKESWEDYKREVIDPSLGGPFPDSIKELTTFFAELAFINGAGRMASAVASTNSKQEARDLLENVYAELERYSKSLEELAEETALDKT